jgi:carbonic anhydrase
MATKAKRAGFCVSVLAGLCLATPAFAEGMSASESLKDMMAGNETFQKNEVLGKRRAATAQSQSPQAIIVSCSDSRVPPEAVFNRYLGRLFIVRTAGHAIGDYEFASIEYAVEHLHVPLIVVLGHERCGAIKATVEAEQKGGGGEEPAGDAHGGGGGHEADEADADHGHGKKHHRAERGRVSQRDSACAPKKKAHGHDDAEDAEDADAEDGDGHKAKGHGKAEKPAKGKKAKKAKGHAKGHGDDEEDADAEDADAEDEDGGHAKAKGHGKAKAKAHGDDEEDADDDGGHAKPKAKPKAAPAHHGAHEHITSLVKELSTPVRVALKSKPADPVDAAVRVNTKWVAKRLVDESGVVREAVEAGKLKIVSARYDLDTGAVEVLE